MLRYAWFNARKDLAVMLRERETLLWVFLMPLIFFYFIGTVTGGIGLPGGDDEPEPLVVRGAAPGDLLTDELLRRLEREGYEVQPEAPEAPEENRQRRAPRTLVLPASASHESLTAGVLAGERVKVRLEHDEEELGTHFDRMRVAKAVYGVLADLAVLAQRGEPATRAGFEELAAAPRALTLEVRPAGKRRHVPNGFEQTIPGTMTMFCMLVLLTSGAVLLVIEREQGLLRRLASTPIPRGAIVLGKWAGKMALALVQIAFAMLAGALFFGMRWGASLPMVGAVLCAWAAFNASLAILLANLARSEGQTTGIAVLATMVLAALGGCWWPIEIAPGWMQRLALFLPTGWTMDALHELVSFGSGPAAAVPHAAALSAGALVLGWLAARTFRYA